MIKVRWEDFTMNLLDVFGLVIMLSVLLHLALVLKSKKPKAFNSNLKAVGFLVMVFAFSVVFLFLGSNLSPRPFYCYAMAVLYLLCFIAWVPKTVVRPPTRE